MAYDLFPYYLFYIIVKLYKNHIILFLPNFCFAVFLRKVNNMRMHARTHAHTYTSIRVPTFAHTNKWYVGVMM